MERQLEGFELEEYQISGRGGGGGKKERQGDLWRWFLYSCYADPLAGSGNWGMVFTAREQGAKGP